MPSSALTSKGQITVPVEIRRALGLNEGDRIAFRIRDDGVVEIEPETVDILSLKGTLKPKKKGVTIEEMKRAVADGALRK